MSTENLGNLDNIVMGVGKEHSEEEKKKMTARSAAASAKIKAIQKDESHAHKYDLILAKVIKKASLGVIQFIVFLINKNLPSLTILSFLFLEHTEVETLLHKELGKIYTHKSTLEHEKLALDKITTRKIDEWFFFISIADQESKTKRLKDFQKDTDFTKNISKGLSHIIRDFFTRKNITEFNQKELENILNKRGKSFFL